MGENQTQTLAIDMSMKQHVSRVLRKMKTNLKLKSITEHSGQVKGTEPPTKQPAGSGKLVRSSSLAADGNENSAKILKQVGTRDLTSPRKNRCNRRYFK